MIGIIYRAISDDASLRMVNDASLRARSDDAHLKTVPDDAC